MKNFPCLFLALLFAACNSNTPPPIEATGTLEATETVVSAQVSGIVRSILVEEGAEVHAGDTLVLIDPTEYELQLRQAEANAEALAAQYELMVKGAREEDILQAEATYRNAEEDYRRMKELYAANSASKKQLDDSETRYIIAKQTYEKLKKGSRSEEVRAARARRDQALAQVELLKKKLRDCAIVAPVSGSVIRRYVERGELASPGMAVARIANLREMTVRIYVTEAELPRISYDQNADVFVDAFPDRPFKGNVRYISSVAEFTPKNIQTKEERTKLVFAVKIKVENPDGILKAGIPADVVVR